MSAITLEVIDLPSEPSPSNVQLDTIKAVAGVERTETPLTLSSAKENWTVSLEAVPL